MAEVASDTETVITNPNRDAHDAAREAIEQIKTRGPENEAGGERSPSIGNDGQPAPLDEGGKTRDANGQFKSAPKARKAQPAQGAPAQEPTNEVLPEDDTAKPSDQVQSDAPIAAPAGWAADAKAAWASVPPAVQKAVLKREEEMQRGGQQWSTEKRAYESTLAPLVQAARKRGIDPNQGLQQLLAANQMFEENAPAAIAILARQHGVDLEALVANPGAVNAYQEQQQQQQLHSRFNALEGAITGFMQNQSLGLVNAFASSDEHPFYEEVEADIERILPTIIALNPGASPSQVLNAAYEQAAWSNPSVKAKLLEGQARTTAQDNLSTIKSRSDRAAAAAVSVRGSSSGSPASKSGKAEKGGDHFDAARKALQMLRAR